MILLFLNMTVAALSILAAARSNFYNKSMVLLTFKGSTLRLTRGDRTCVLYIFYSILTVLYKTFFFYHIIRILVYSVN